MNQITILGLLFISVFTLSVAAQKSKEVKVKTDNGKLYGTLLTPKSGKDAPIVIIIPGSGPTDRNGNSMMLQSNAYSILADSLQQKNIGSLRYDKQGIGESKDARVPEGELRFEDLVKDVEHWIDFLDRKGFENIYLLGHSQGSLIGMIAAQRANIKGFISLAGAGNTIDKILEKQLAQGADEYYKDTERILKSMRSGDTTHNVPSPLLTVFRPDIQPFLISWMNYDPVVEIAKLNIPVLVIQGTTDIQVDQSEGRMLAASSNSDLQLIKGMNHVLKSAPADRAKNIQTYYDPNLPLHEGLVPALLEFLYSEK
tara:strand:- start:220093 stop:221031 length:939 start_codon:yes stop_codon:yes gene_type:complete